MAALVTRLHSFVATGLERGRRSIVEDLGRAVHVAVDFGTTNSALAVARTVDGDASRPGRARVELATFTVEHEELSTFPSILYSSPAHRGRDRRALVFAGHEAFRRYLADRVNDEDEPVPTRGRLLQSLKSHLPSAQFTTTNVHGTMFTLEALVGRILTALRDAAEARLGPLGRSVLAGRPVHFAGARSDEDEALALLRLRAAYALAGFADVVFELEPVGAAYAYGARLERAERVLIGDFGGGTSDFSLVRMEPAGDGAGPASVVLATRGVAVGGDTFDGALVRHVVTPLLGDGGTYRSPFGKSLPVPSWLFASFARWHHLALLKTPQTLTMLGDIERGALDREAIRALRHVIEDELGYEVYLAVARTKHALSSADHATLDLEAAPVHINERVSRADFERWIEPDLTRIDEAVESLLTASGITADHIDSVFLTGGSSLVPAVRERFARRFGDARLRGGAELTSVAQGLALRACEEKARS